MALPRDSRTVSLGVPGKPDYLVLARLALSAVCRLTPLGPDDVADLKLAVTEAASSLMGPRLRVVGDGVVPHERLDFRFRLEDDRLVLEVMGPPGTGLHLEERDLGRAIIEATVDETYYGAGSVRLVKYLACAAG